MNDDRGGTLLSDAPALTPESNYYQRLLARDRAEAVDIVERFECDAVIMGARGMGPLSAAMVGAVSQAVLKSSPVPVTIVRPREEPEAEEESEPTL